MSVKLSRRSVLVAGIGFGLDVRNLRAQPHIVRNDLDAWIGDARDPTDVTARIRLAAASGQIVRLTPNAVYPLTAGLRFASRTVFECDGARPATFHLLTRSGQFDASDFRVNPLAPSRLALRIEAVDHVRLLGFDLVLEASEETRTAIGVQLRRTSDCELDSIHLRGFREQNGGYLRVDSDRRSLLHGVGVHNCAINSSVLPSQQGTGIDVDNNRARDADGQPIDSSETRISGAVCEDLTMTQDALNTYGWQTDGMKVQSDGHSVTITDLTVRNTGQGLDLWASECTIRNASFKDIGIFPIKLIYGASRNTLSGIRCNGTGLAAVIVSDGVRALDQPTACDNQIEVQAENVGKLWQREGGARSMAPEAAFQIEGNHIPDSARKPHGNVISGCASGFVDGGRALMPYVGFNLDAGVNVFDIGGTGYGKAVFGKNGQAVPVVRLNGAACASRSPPIH